MKNANLRQYIAGSTSKYISIVIMMLIVLGVIFIPPFEQKVRFQINREKWESQNITHYRFDLEISCFCPVFWGTMPVTIEIKDGQIISMMDVNGIALDDYLYKEIEDIGTIEKLFDLAQKGISEAHSVGISYDNTFGFPASIDIDLIRTAIDDEHTYSISNFEVLP